MKITGVRQFYSNRFHFIRLETDGDLYGVAEATLRVKQKPIAETIELIVNRMIREDVSDIEWMFDKFFGYDRWRGGVVVLTAIAAIETAMLDLLGKQLGVPVCDLLGGKIRDEVPVYASGFAHGCRTDEALAERVKDLRAQGFRAFKSDPVPLPPYGTPERNVITKEQMKKGIETVYKWREMIGEDSDLLVECHGRFSYDQALYFLHAIEDADPFFAEEPVNTDDYAGYRKLADNTSVPLAAGERWFTRYGHRPVMEKRILRVAQPDFAHCGGLFEAKKMAANAELFGSLIAPHNSNHVLSTIAALHVDATVPNLYKQEYMSWRPEYWNLPFVTEDLKERFRVENGCISMKDLKPGLGIDLDPGLLETTHKDTGTDW